MRDVKFSDGETRKCLTRREVMKLWEDLADEILDSLCCPACRDILLVNNDGEFSCSNNYCKITEAEK